MVKKSIAGLPLAAAFAVKRNEIRVVLLESAGVRP